MEQTRGERITILKKSVVKRDKQKEQDSPFGDWQWLLAAWILTQAPQLNACRSPCFEGMTCRNQTNDQNWRERKIKFAFREVLFTGILLVYYQLKTENMWEVWMLSLLKWKSEYTKTVVQSFPQGATLWGCFPSWFPVSSCSFIVESISKRKLTVLHCVSGLLWLGQ